MSLNFLGLLRSQEPEKMLGGRYQIVRQLGAGGFGQTFVAADLHLPNHPQCVLKQLKPKFSDPHSLQIARRLFDTEATVLYQLGDHDQIPRLLAHFEQNQEFYLAQELIVGDALDALLANGQPWTQTAVVTLLQDILTVLAFVHQQGVIHRDIKPSNLIRRQQDGRIVLIDFGAVKQVSGGIVDATTGQSSLTVAVGTYGYMPNEQLAGNPRFSSDVYAVGMIGIQALTGINPRNLDEDPRTGELQWHDPSTAPAIHPELAAVLARMIRYDFRQRYETAVEALDAIRGLPIAELEDPAALSTGTAIVTPMPVTATRSDTPVKPTPPLQTLALPKVALSPSPPTNAIAPSPAPTVAARANAAPFGVTLLPSLTSRELIAQRVAQAQSTEKPTSVIERSIQSAVSTLTAVTFLLPQLAQKTVAQSRSKPWLPLSGFAVVILVALIGKSLLPTQPVSKVATESALSTATPSASDQVQALLQQAKQLQDGKQSHKALTLYNQAISMDAKNAEAYWGRCYTLNRLTQYKDALVACNRALTLKPNYPEALWSKGYIFDQQEHYTESLALYNRAIALKPDFAEAWSNKGTALLRLNRLSEAMTAFDRALKLKPNLAEAWNNRGATLWSLHRFDDAIASIDKALQIQPNYHDARSLRDQMRQKLGR